MNPKFVGKAVEHGSDAVRAVAEHGTAGRMVEGAAAVGDPEGHHRSKIVRTAVWAGTAITCVALAGHFGNQALDRGLDTVEGVPGAAASAAGEVIDTLTSPVEARVDSHALITRLSYTAEEQPLIRGDTDVASGLVTVGAFGLTGKNIIVTRSGSWVQRTPNIKETFTTTIEDVEIGADSVGNPVTEERLYTAVKASGLEAAFEETSVSAQVNEKFISGLLGDSNPELKAALDHNRGVAAICIDGLTPFLPEAVELAADAHFGSDPRATLPAEQTTVQELIERPMRVEFFDDYGNRIDVSDIKVRDVAGVPMTKEQFATAVDVDVEDVFGTSDCGVTATAVAEALEEAPSVDGTTSGMPTPATSGQAGDLSANSFGYSNGSSR